MRTLAIGNHKGGTAKTTTAANLGAALAGRYKTLLVDLDPQSSLTNALGLGDCSGRSMAEVLGGAGPGRLQLADVARSIAPGLDLAPADISLAAVELGLTSRMGREIILKKLLATVTGYDLVIIDCPPSLGLLTVNGLTAADGVISPTLPQAADLRGLAIFTNSLQQIREALNPDLQLIGVVVVQYDQRLNHHREALELLQQSGLPLFDTRIGRSVKAAEAAGVGLPLVNYEPGNPRAAEYNQLAEEVNRWLKSQP
jgi:chromosome partitioning protein